MKLLNFFRRPSLAIFMAALILFASCSSGVNDTEVRIDASTLENMHEQIKYDLSNVDEASVLKASSNDMEEEFLRNLHYTNEYGVEALFEKNGLDVKFLDMVEFYKQVEDDGNVYQLLVDNFEINGEEDALYMLNLIEVYGMVEEGMLAEGDAGCLKSVAGDKISLACILAIAGTITTTASAAFVTGGAALIVFLAAKGIGTAAIIQACT